MTSKLELTQTVPPTGMVVLQTTEFQFIRRPPFPFMEFQQLVSAPQNHFGQHYVTKL